MKAAEAILTEGTHGTIIVSLTDLYLFPAEEAETLHTDLPLIAVAVCDAVIGSLYAGANADPLHTLAVFGAVAVCDAVIGGLYAGADTDSLHTLAAVGAVAVMGAG